ncbi:hypothetical protein F2Q69_00044337 [Brassica cretica]|uniref:Uncharacterized protein n=1 Tax=Brassica cretica TaxID=69181 RepID=A0A8S9NC81_BRACR|nr:hypothetical protein F2Q69_00044337 [Brassica cretica]
MARSSSSYLFVHHHRKTPYQIALVQMSPMRLLAILLSRKCSVSSPNPSLLKLQTNSPLKLSFMDKFKQISSRQGRERSSSTSSFQERIFPPQSLFVRGDPHPVFKTGNIYQYLNRLLSYVKVRLGPVDATTFIPKGVEVLDGVATSHVIVTNRSFAN